MLASPSAGLLIPTFIGISLLPSPSSVLLPGDPSHGHGRRARHVARAPCRSSWTSSVSTGRSGSSISTYLLGRCPWRFRHVDLATKRPVLQRIPDAFSGDARAVASAPCSSPSSSAFRPASSPRSSAVPPRISSIMGIALAGYSMPIFWWGLLLIILFSGILHWTPVSGRIVAHLFLSAGHRLHADRQPAVGAERRLRIGRFASHLADHRARHHSARRDRPADALGHARSVWRGLCAHRPRQGPAAAPRHRRPCFAQCHDPGHHHHRPAGRPAPRRRHPDRDDLLLAGHRQMDGRCDLPARLSRRAGRPPADRLDRHARQSDRRSALRPHQPADQPP